MDRGLDYTVETSCSDGHEHTLGAREPNYVVAAMDRADLKSDESAVRKGDETAL